MKKRILSLAAALCAMLALALPAAAENVGAVTPAEHDDIMGVLFDGAPYMSFDASQTTVKLQVPEELRNVGALQVYDYRHGIKLMINNVDDVTPDADGYIELTLPSTGEFAVAKVPYTEAYRLTLDLRYLDESVWASAKTPDEPFDTDLYIIPQGEWRDSKTWREQQGLDPWPTAEAEAEPEPEEESSAAEQEPDDTQSPESSLPEGESSQPASTPEQQGSSAEDESLVGQWEDPADQEPQFPLSEQPFPWGSYVVVAISAALGVFLVQLLLRKR